MNDEALVRKLAHCDHEIHWAQDESTLTYTITHEPHGEVAIVVDLLWILESARTELIMKIVNWIREVHKYQEKLND